MKFFGNLTTAVVAFAALAAAAPAPEDGGATIAERQSCPYGNYNDCVRIQNLQCRPQCGGPRAPRICVQQCYDTIQRVCQEHC